MIETIQAEENAKLTDILNEYQAYREEVKNKSLEETNAMKMYLDAR